VKNPIGTLVCLGVIVSIAILRGCPADAQTGRTSVVAGPIYEGQELTCDLAPQEQFHNIGSKKDGAGMCVFTSIEMAARAQGLEQMRGWRDWCASNFSGGGWPGRVDDYLAKWFKAKGLEPIPYYQYEGPAPEKVLTLIDKTGRMACITYGWSPRYGRGISHMVCSPGYGKFAAVLDNNFVSKKTPTGYDENIYEWMEPVELCRRMKLGGGSAWIFCWLPPPPPPPARSAS
jgi:hypothetical protein